MFFDHLKSFYNKYLLKSSLVLCLTLLVVFGVIIWTDNEPIKDVEIFLPNIKKNDKSNLKEDIIEFLPTEENNDSSASEELKEEPLVEEDKTADAPAIKIEKDTKNNHLDNDYLIDLYQKIDSLNEHVENLQQEILHLKKNQKVNAQNDNASSTVLIELYRIKNIALLGEDFSAKIPALLSITKSYPEIQENLFILKSIKQLPKYEVVEKLLVEVEDTILKEDAQKKFEEDKKVSSRVKLNLWDYIKIKKVKNLSEEDPLLKIKNIRTSIHNGDYKQAYNVATKLSEIYPVANELTKKLESFNNFSNTLDNLFTIILDQEETLS